MACHAMLYVDRPVCITLQDFAMDIEKDEFEFHVSHLFDRCMKAVADLLREARIAAVSGASHSCR